MRSVVQIHQDVVGAISKEPGRVRDRFNKIVGSLETGWPKLTQLLYGDKRITYSLRRRSQYGIAVDYTTDWFRGAPIYTILAVHYLATRSVFAREETLNA
jgi:hypothetical protein